MSPKKNKKKLSGKSGIPVRRSGLSTRAATTVKQSSIHTTPNIATKAKRSHLTKQSPLSSKNSKNTIQKRGRPKKSTLQPNDNEESTPKQSKGQRLSTANVTPASSPRANKSLNSSGIVLRSSLRQRKSYDHSFKRSLYLPAKDGGISGVSKYSSQENIENLPPSAEVSRSTRKSSLNRRKVSTLTESPTSSKSPNESGRRLPQSGYTTPTTGSSGSKQTPSVSVLQNKTPKLLLKSSTPVVRTPLNPPIVPTTLNTPFKPPPSVNVAPREQTSSATAEEQNQWDEQVADWLSKTWKLSYVSAVQGLNIGSQSLCASYRKSLQQKIAQGFAFSIHVVISPYSCISCNSANIDGVEISITYSIPQDWELQQQSRGKRKKDKVQLYKALLFKGDMSNNMATEVGADWYPLMFYWGRESIHHQVTDWLCDVFGCYVAPRSIIATSLMWAVGIWCRKPCKNKGQVELHYGISGLNCDGWQQHKIYKNSTRTKVGGPFTVKLNMAASEMAKIANCIMSDDAEVTVSDRDLLNAVILQTLEKVTCLPVTTFRIQAVKTDCVALGRLGQVRVSCKRHFRELLKCLLQLHLDDSLLEKVRIPSDINLSQCLSDDEE